MSRRRRAEKRVVLPDAKFGDQVLTKFMNVLMYDGKKSAAERIVYGALDIVESRTKADPIASFTVSAISGQAPLTVNFSGILSTDSDGIITKYEWDFGDGGSGSGKSTSHTYSSAGSFTAVLLVTDDSGGQDTAQKTITVTAPPDDGDGGGWPYCELHRDTSYRGITADSNLQCVCFGVYWL